MENAKFICDQANRAQTKSCPEEYYAAFQGISAVADTIKTQSFTSFRKDIMLPLFGKDSVMEIADVTKIIKKCHFLLMFALCPKNIIPNDDPNAPPNAVKVIKITSGVLLLLFRSSKDNILSRP